MSSASSSAWLRPSITPGLMACILVLMLAISTSSSSVQTRIESSSCSVGAGASPGRQRWRRRRPRGTAGADTPAASTAARSCFCVGLHEPSARVHARFATGRRTPRPAAARLHSALPASMSSLIHCATCFQPASCHSSNGPCFTPKPQRIAKSTSRALSAIAAQVHGSVMEAVAQDRPEELRLRVARFAQQLQPLGGGLLQHALDDVVGLAAAGHVVAAWRSPGAGCPCRPSCRSRRRSSGPARRLPAASSAPPAWRSWRRTDRSRPACPASS